MESGYHQLPRRTSQDPHLSYEALGVIAYIDSKSDSWTPRMMDMRKAHPREYSIDQVVPIGKDKMQRIMSDLVSGGYARLIRGDNTRWEICNVPIWRFQNELSMSEVFKMVESGEVPHCHDFWGASFTADRKHGCRKTRQPENPAATKEENTTKGKISTSSFLLQRKEAKETSPGGLSEFQQDGFVDGGWDGKQVSETLAKISEARNSPSTEQLEKNPPQVAPTPPGQDGVAKGAETAPQREISPDPDQVQAPAEKSSQIEAMSLVPDGVRKLPWQAEWIAENYQPEWFDVIALMQKSPMGRESWKKTWRHPLFYNSRKATDQQMLAALMKRASQAGVGRRRKCSTFLNTVIDQTWEMQKENGKVMAEWVRLMSDSQFNSNEFVAKWNDWCEIRKNGRNRSSPTWAKNQLEALDQVDINTQISLLDSAIRGEWGQIDPHKFVKPNQITSRHERPKDDQDPQGAGISWEELSKIEMPEHIARKWSNRSSD